MCQRISDRNKFHTFSLEKEYDKLDALFHDRRVFCFVREASIMLQCAKPNIIYYNCIQNMFFGLESSWVVYPAGRDDGSLGD